MSFLIYPDITDHINKRKYRVVSPQVYNTRIPDIYFDGVAPIYEVRDTRDASPSRATIHEMIDMRANSISFTILNPDDVIDIKLHLDIYLAKLSLCAGAPEADAYIDKAQIFHRDITKAAIRTVKRNKTTKKLKQTDNVLEKILSGDDLTITKPKEATDSDYYIK